MAHLITDIGNSKVKVALMQDGTILRQASFPSLGPDKLQQWIGDIPVHHAIFSDVRNQGSPLTDFLKQHYHAYELTHTLPVPVAVRYATPQTLGKDRLAGVTGALHLYPGAHCLVIDLGTSITYDLITAAGDYLGGQILPGLHMRFKALHQFTGKLPLAQPVAAPPLLGTTTETSLQSGVQWGIVHEIEGFVAQYEDTYGRIHVILTGGDAPVFESLVKCRIFAHPNLILIGLNKILEYNVDLAS